MPPWGQPELAMSASTDMSVTASDVVGFWLEAGYDKWFNQNDAFDAEIGRRFRATHEAAARGELTEWERTAGGALALLILLDQFPRNMFRGLARTYATDRQARAVADRAIAQGFDTAVDPSCRGFFYLPFMHSEERVDLDRCERLYEAAGDEDGLKYARHHRDIVARFGRFPHRNAMLGRATTAEEQAFLDAGGFNG
jgi:uncharacterized protein (DUF924 family)